MAYHTLDDLTAKLSAATVVQLTDDAGAETVDTAITSAAAASAQDIIDPYLRKRYTLPLQVVPGILREISVSLTVYELWRRRASEQMPKSVVDERKDAIRLLEHIADNRIALFETDKATTYLTNKRPSDQIFPASVLDTM